MGLVLGWEFDGPGSLKVDLCVTFAGCTMAPHFVEAARCELLKIEGVERVDLTVDTNFFWTPERMSADPEAPAGAAPPEPQEWKKKTSRRS